jgi:hypothetical protein
MKEETIKEATRIARHFIERANRVIKSENPHWEITGTKASGELRRISMELTRVLADMRKP